MKNIFFNPNKYWVPILVLSLGAELSALGQARGGGAAGGGGGAGGRSSSSTTTRTYPNNSSIGDAYFSIDPESRQVVTIADEETTKAISMVLSNLDRPKPQVLIKVVFLEVTHSDDSDIGIEGGWTKGIGQGNTANAANVFGLGGLAATNSPLNSLGQPISSFAAVSPMTAGGAGLYQLYGQNFQATLRAVAQAGRAKVLSRPYILARNNQPATITVGQEVPLITSVRYDTFGNAIYTPTYTDVGVILSVTPFITSDGLVEMIISPQVSSIDPTLTEPITANVNVPAIDIRSANTVAVTPDGVTVVIGGLMQDSKSSTEIKIPVLGDIPWIGNLFKRTQKSSSKDELIIFLTPYIVQKPSQLAALSVREAGKADAPNEFDQRTLDRFLDTLPLKGQGSGKK